MSIAKKIALAAVGVLAVLLLAGFLLPREIHVERSLHIDAPQPTLFAVLNGYRLYNEWSPWAEKDPTARYSFEGPDFGLGARLIWHSDDPQVGTGMQEIVASRPHERIEVRLDFGGEGLANSYFHLEPHGSLTRLTWGFDTQLGSNPLDRYLGVMFDRWVGRDYEVGLLKLQKLAEALPKEDWSDLEIEVVEVEPVTIACASGSSSWDVAEIGQALGATFGQVVGFMRRQKLDQVGPPLALTVSATDEEWVFDAGIPIGSAPEAELPEGSPVRFCDTYGGRALRAKYVGPYSGIQPAWRMVMAFVKAHGLEPAGNTWEEYASDPGDTPEDQLVTNLGIPVQ